MHETDRAWISINEENLLNNMEELQETFGSRDATLCPR